MNKILLSLILLISFSAFSQKQVKKELASIETIDQAENYLETKKSKKNKLMAFNEEKHKTKLAKMLLEMPVGATKIVDSEFSQTHYKIVDKTNEPHYRISYIFLDETKVDIDKIYEIRKTVMYEYENGIRFEDLAKRYSMDDNAIKGGDSGWFKEGEMPEEIDKEVSDLSHDLDSIYSVRVPSENGYYIILKTYRVQTIKEVKVLKIVEPKD